jgi:hypothetical protein
VIDRPYDDIVGELSANATVDIVKGNMAKMRTVKMYFDGPRFLFQLVARTGEVGQ